MAYSQVATEVLFALSGGRGQTQFDPFHLKYRTSAATSASPSSIATSSSSWPARTDGLIPRLRPPRRLPGLPGEHESLRALVIGEQVL
jgi:hypothetical protein